MCSSLSCDQHNKRHGFHGSNDTLSPAIIRSQWCSRTGCNFVLSSQPHNSEESDVSERFGYSLSLNSPSTIAKSPTVLNYASSPGAPLRSLILFVSCGSCRIMQTKYFVNIYLFREEWFVVSVLMPGFTNSLHV